MPLIFGDLIGKLDMMQGRGGAAAS